MELISQNASNLLIGSLENFPKNRALLEQCSVKCLETCHHYKTKKWSFLNEAKWHFLSTQYLSGPWNTLVLLNLPLIVQP